MPTTIGPGATGDDVKRLQRVLARQLLWNPFGPITGVFDAGLETAVKEFQQSNGLTVDGIVGPATWAKLPAYREASPTLQTWLSGPAVAWLQQAPSGADVAVQFPAYSGRSTASSARRPQHQSARYRAGLASRRRGSSTTTPGSSG